MQCFFRQGAGEMKVAIILETKEHEKAWNAFRFGVAALKKAHEVKFFLMGEAVEVESIENEQYDVPAEMKKLAEQGGELLACGTCLKSRQLEDHTACPISTMFDCVEMVEWADEVVTF
jgi:sulfur relay (sulfurtransferase) complex TusBCD TusD component (DsrE family)